MWKLGLYGVKSSKQERQRPVQSDSFYSAKDPAWRIFALSNLISTFYEINTVILIFQMGSWRLRESSLRSCHEVEI